MKFRNKKNGMTILELILGISVILVLSTATIGYYRGQIVQVSLDSNSKIFVADINSAKIRAMAGDRGMDWGVRAIPGTGNIPGTWVLFATSSNSIESGSFISNTNTLSSGLIWVEPASGTKEIIFKAITGEASSTNFIIGNLNKKVEINVSDNSEISIKYL